MIQLEDTRLVATIDGAITIGRDPGNAVVIDHPTVSRRHARIECHADEAHLSDLGSRNGTRLNGRVVVHRQKLADGMRLRIGHVPCWFFRSRPDDATLEKLSIKRVNPRGITARCVCGVKLWAMTDTLLRSTPCPSCGSINTIEGTPAPASAETFAEQAVASGAVCGVCQWAIEPGDAVTVCPGCATRFHTECWRENRGCSSYGCEQVNALDPQRDAAAPAAPPSLPTSADLERETRRTGKVLLLAAGAALPVSAIAFGVPSVASLIFTLLRRHETSDGWAAGAAVVGLIGLLA
ncbi:MAG TPA: FHA domain-containing protein, partial [Tepidisphaeraceae bacterium]|nr:FHA domain-containing protein [Tepidisphaeraceae bacterium]